MVFLFFCNLFGLLKNYDSQVSLTILYISYFTICLAKLEFERLDLRSVEAIAGDSVLLTPKAPQPRGRVLVQRGQGGKQSPLVRGQHLLLLLRRRLRLPMLNTTKMIIPLLVFLDLFGGESRL